MLVGKVREGRGICPGVVTLAALMAGAILVGCVACGGSSSPAGTAESKATTHYANPTLAFSFDYPSDLKLTTDPNALLAKPEDLEGEGDSGVLVYEPGASEIKKVRSGFLVMVWTLESELSTAEAGHVLGLLEEHYRLRLATDSGFRAFKLQMTTRSGLPMLEVDVADSNGDYTSRSRMQVFAQNGNVYFASIEGPEAAFAGVVKRFESCLASFSLE